jgi:hypothetical protein
MSRKNPRFRRVNPALPGTTNTIMQLAAVGVLDQQEIVSTFTYLSNNSPPAPGEELALANAWVAAAISTDFLDCLSAGYSLLAVKVTCLSDLTRTPAVKTLGAGLPGGVAGTHEPTTVAGVISRYTAFKGQHGRGRLMMPAIPSSFVDPTTDANSLTAAALAIYQTFCTQLLVTVTVGAATYSLAIASRPLTTVAWRNAAIVTVIVPRPLLGNVRRRRVGRGK